MKKMTKVVSVLAAVGLLGTASVVAFASTRDSDYPVTPTTAYVQQADISPQATTNSVQTLARGQFGRGFDFSADMFNFSEEQLAEFEARFGGQLAHLLPDGTSLQDVLGGLDGILENFQSGEMPNFGDFDLSNFDLSNFDLGDFDRSQFGDFDISQLLERFDMEMFNIDPEQIAEAQARLEARLAQALADGEISQALYDWTMGIAQTIFAAMPTLLAELPAFMTELPALIESFQSGEISMPDFDEIDSEALLEQLTYALGLTDYLIAEIRAIAEARFAEFDLDGFDFGEFDLRDFGGSMPDLSDFNLDDIIGGFGLDLTDEQLAEIESRLEGFSERFGEAWGGRN